VSFSSCFITGSKATSRQYGGKESTAVNGQYGEDQHGVVSGLYDGIGPVYSTERNGTVRRRSVEIAVDRDIQ
jgi:hypothetical protein